MHIIHSLTQEMKFNLLCIWISTFVNALYDAGFIIEKMIEQTDEKSLADTEDNSPKAQKAKMVPLSMCFKCRKL